MTAMPHTSTARADSAIVAMRREAAEAVRRSRDACDATHAQIAAQVCCSPARLSQYVDPECDTTIDVARAALAPEPMRLALASLVAGPRFVVVHADAEHVRDLHTIVRELSDVMSVAAASEADGYVSPEEAERELAEWADVERVMSARREWLRRAQRGAWASCGGRCAMKIFLAGPSAELPRVREAAAQIEAAGHTLTERWWEKVADTGVCASDVDRDEVVLNTAGSANARGISRADAVVLLCRASGGLSPGAAHEAGWAQATDKPVVLVGDPKGHLAPWWPSCGTATVDTVADALEIAGAL